MSVKSHLEPPVEAGKPRSDMRKPTLYRLSGQGGRMSRDSEVPHPTSLRVDGRSNHSEEASECATLASYPQELTLLMHCISTVWLGVDFRSSNGIVESEN